MGTIGFVGGGNMAEALIKGIIVGNVYSPDDILVSDVRLERVEVLAKKYHVRTVDKNADLAARADIVVLSIKPQNMTDALMSIKKAVKADTLVVSIAAGIKIADIEAALGDMAIVRVMPNTPALIGEGISAVYANEKAKSRIQEAESILTAVGEVVVIETEELMDAVTAVSGSGPAYYFLLMEEMIKAAEKLGLTGDIAKKLVLQTAKGAALLAVQAGKKGETAAELRRKVTSPGGTTEAALKVFTQRKFGPLVTEAIKKACDRGRELAKKT